MNIHKVVMPTAIGKSFSVEDFDHFVSLDWSMTVMAVAHMGQRSKEATVLERPAELKDLKQYPWGGFIPSDR